VCYDVFHQTNENCLDAFVFRYSTFAELPNKVFDLSPYKNLGKWLQKAKDEYPDYEKANWEGARAFADLFKEKTAHL
jgi:hypothetical protein